MHSNVGTPCMGELTGHIAGRLRLSGQSQCENFLLVNLTAVDTITSSKVRGSSLLLESMFLDISAVSGQIFLKPTR